MVLLARKHYRRQARREALQIISEMIPDCVTNRSFLLPRNTSISAVLAGLKTLMLDIPTDEISDTDDNPSFACVDVEDTPLRLFLHHTTQLQSLRLNFLPYINHAGHPRRPRTRHQRGWRIVDWLGRPISVAAKSAPLTDSPTPPVHLPFLTSLELGKTMLTTADLVRTLAKFDLQSFSLHRICLDNPRPDSIAQDCWAQFLSQLSTSLSPSCRIRKIMIRQPSQGPYRWRVRGIHNGTSVVRFVPEGTDAANKAKAEKLCEIAFDSLYTGRTVHEWLRDMSGLTYIQWPLGHPVGVRLGLDMTISEDTEEDEDGGGNDSDA